MCQIKLHKQATKFILSLTRKQQRQIGTALISLQQNKWPQDAKKLQGYDFYRVDYGEYRIIYSSDDAVISVYIIGERNDWDVYQKLQRKF